MEIKAFDELVGKTFDFYGVDMNEFKLDDTVFEAVEDPDDGYRSYLETVEVVNNKGIFFSQPLAQVVLEKYDIGSEEGYKLIDIKDNHEWLSFGTDDYDDWYPCFFFDYNPKSE